MSETYSQKLAENYYRTLYKECGCNEEIHSATLEPFAAEFAGLSPVLDLGCGSGMFLRILLARKVSCTGVEGSQECVEACRQANLPAVKSDVFEYLRATADSSYGGIFCSHLIEHLMPAQALELYSEAYRVLQAQGKLVILTPNFRHLTVAAEGFWLDLTHVRPYPGHALTVLATMAGFRQKRCITYRNKNGLIPYLGNAVRWLLTGGLHAPAGRLGIVCIK